MGGCDPEIFGRIVRLSSEEVLLQQMCMLCIIVYAMYAVVVATVFGE